MNALPLVVQLGDQLFPPEWPMWVPVRNLLLLRDGTRRWWQQQLLLLSVKDVWVVSAVHVLHGMHSKRSPESSLCVKRQRHLWWYQVARHPWWLWHSRRQLQCLLWQWQL